MSRRNFDYEAWKRKFVKRVGQHLQVCDYYFNRGRSAKEIGAMTNKSEAAVRGILHRARELGKTVRKRTI